MFKGCQSPGLSPELEEALDRMKKMRGTEEVRARKERAVIRFMSNLHSSNRVFGRGEWYGKEYHYPAVLIYNTNSKIVSAWIPEGDDDTMTSMGIECYHCRVPHQAIAREVIDNPKVTT